MIYVIDNGGEYSCHRVYFVDAPEDFGQYLDGEFFPWARTNKVYCWEWAEILATAKQFDWREPRTSTPVEEFCAKIGEFDLDRGDDTTARPRYRMEPQL